MIYKFYPVESKIVDLLSFPKCVRFIQESEHENQTMLEFVSEKLIEEFKELEMALKPYEKQIRNFYFDEFSVPEFMMKSVSVFGHTSASSYLEHIQILDQKMILKSILTKLYLVKFDLEVVDETIIYDYVESVEKQIQLIESMDVSDEEKWKLSSLLRQPKQVVGEWIAFMKSIEPLFEEYYQWKMEKVITFGQYLQEKLNLTDEDALENLTDGLVSKKLIPTENFLVSFVEPINIEINVSSSVPYLKMGVEIETFLQVKKEIEENQLKDRVNIFKNLGDKTRYEVVKLIAQGVESAKEIAQTLNVSQPTISYHMNHLLLSKVIKLERVDSKFVHIVNFEQLKLTYEQMLKDFGK